MGMERLTFGKLADSDLARLYMKRKQAYWDNDMELVTQITEEIDNMPDLQTKKPQRLKLTKKYVGNEDSYP